MTDFPILFLDGFNGAGLLILVVLAAVVWLAWARREARR